jgi:hypothetical protein
VPAAVQSRTSGVLSFALFFPTSNHLIHTASNKNPHSPSSSKEKRQAALVKNKSINLNEKN